MFDRPAPYSLPAAALTASFLALSACEQRAEPAPPPAAAPQVPAPAPVPAPPPAPVAPAALDRVELLRAMDKAAAAYAAGEAGDTASLAGRRFALRQAFGCFGPAEAGDAVAEDGLARWSWKDKRQAIEVSLAPGEWTKSALVTGAGPDWEAVEGLWLVRPWLSSDACPGPLHDPLASGPPAPSPQTMGLAAVFEAGGSRLGRRNGRAYVATVRAKDGETLAAPKAGYRLVLEGRLVGFDDGRAVHCRADSPDQRPVCVAAARLDRVAFEDPEGGVLREWRPG
jgi:hypothetical protein